MKLFYDNSAEILKISKRQAAIATSQKVLVTLSIGIFALTSVLLAFDVLCFNAEIMAQFLAAINFICLIILAICLVVKLCEDEPNFIFIAADSDEVCMVTQKDADTMAFFQNGQNVYINRSIFSTRAYYINQHFTWSVPYNYCPKKNVTKWQQKMAKLTKNQIGVECSAKLIVNFVIGPQTLTDQGRFALFLDATGKKDLFDELRKWLNSITKIDHGNLIIPQTKLINNPYGFQQMRVKLIQIVRPTNYDLEII